MIGGALTAARAGAQALDTELVHHVLTIFRGRPVLWLRQLLADQRKSCTEGGQTSKFPKATGRRNSPCGVENMLEHCSDTAIQCGAGWQPAPHWILEPQVSSHLEIARAGYGVADYGESVIVDRACRGVVDPAASAPRVGERHRVGEVESFTDQLELELVFFEREGSIDALIDLEKTGTTQNVSACGSQDPVRRVGKGAAIVIRVT